VCHLSNVESLGLIVFWRVGFITTVTLPISAVRILAGRQQTPPSHKQGRLEWLNQRKQIHLTAAPSSGSII
jgi:hypothetical protein